MEQVITIGLCSFCFLKPFAIRLSFVFNPQILGAFADHDGAPMQGMKIKNVVPGKITYIFYSSFWGSRALICPSKFRFLRQSIFANVLLRCFCCLFVQALSIEAECVAVVTIRGFRGFAIRSLKMISNVGHEGQVTECVLLLQFT